MSLIVSVDRIYQTYFKPEHIGTLNPKKEFRKIPEPKIRNSDEGHKAYRDASDSKSKSRHNTYAEEVMSSPVQTIKANESCQEGLRRMKEKGIHHLLIVEENLITGLVSDKDLLRNPNNMISGVMSEKVLLCLKNTEIHLIAKVMLEERISCTPVVDGDHKLLGMVTRTDLLEYIVRNMPLESWG